MLGVETIGKIRRELKKGTSIREAARKFNKSRHTVRKIRDSDATRFEYERSSQPYPALEQYRGALEDLLAANAQLPDKKKRTLKSLFEELRGKGFEGSYSAVRRYASKWRVATKSSLSDVYVPLSFRKGEAFQFDWSEEEVILNGVPTKVGIAHFRLCYSRMSYIRAYPLEREEMVLDAHARAHDFFGGLCERGIYDNLKTVVAKIHRGKKRDYTLRFLECCSHYLFEPVACTPAAGWEKGQVERQVQILRKQIFTSDMHFSSLDELNDHLEDAVVRYEKVAIHPEISGRTIYSVFEEERDFLIKIPRPFEACISVEKRVSSQCLVRFDKNRYSVPCEYANKTVEQRHYADKVCFYSNGRCVAEHSRVFEQDKTICTPRHYLPILKRKPGALRNGLPFRDWPLGAGIQRIRESLKNVPDGERQFVEILCAIPHHGEESVNIACELAFDAGLTSKDAVLNMLNRVTEDAPAPAVEPPGHLHLDCPPQAACANYDQLLRSVRHA